MELPEIPDKADIKKARFALVEEDWLKEDEPSPRASCSHAKTHIIARSSSESLARELAVRRRTEPPKSKNESSFMANLIDNLPESRKKTVRFKTLSQACAQVLTYQVSDDDDAESYVSLFADAHQESCCRRCCRTIFPMVDLTPYEDLDDEDDSNTWMQVPLWKLNADIDFEEGSASILNWRYRHFVMQECRSQLAMMYTSEKDNGSLRLGCVLYKDGEILPWHPAKKVTLDPLTEDAQDKVIRSLEEYDIAFSTRQHRDYYSQILPAVLYPVKITWRDHAGAEKHLVLASGDPQEAAQLLNAFQKITQILKLRHEELEVDHSRS